MRIRKESPETYTEGQEVFEEWYLRHHRDDLGPKTWLQYARLGVRYQFLSHYWGLVPGWRLRLRTLGGERTYPDFACVGALKSGTTDLASYLMQHPSIIAPLTKEIGHTFPSGWRVYYPTVKEKEAVQRRTGAALSGHFDPLLHDLTLVDNLHAVRPDAKIVIILRDPADRAYSHYKWDRFLAGRGGLAVKYSTTYAQYMGLALEMFPAPNPPSSLPTVPVLAAGIYVNSVAYWLKRFGRDNIAIFTAEEYFADVRKTVCDIQTFLGLTPVAPTLHAVSNRNPLKCPPKDSETDERVREFYRPWNQRLYDLLDRDLGW